MVQTREGNGGEQDIQLEEVIMLSEPHSAQERAVLPSTHYSRAANSKGPPPSYEEAVDPNAPPPLYDSLFGQIRDAHKSSSGFINFLSNLMIILLAIFGCGIILILAVVIPSAMLVVGMVFKHECPYNEDIPTFLLVGGGVCALKHLLYLSSLMCCSKEEDRLRQTGIQSFLTNFLLIWLTFGSLWLNRNNPENTSFDPSSKYYCNESLFTFAMGLAMAVHICLFAAAFFLSSAIIVAFLYHVYHHIRS